MSYAAKTWNSSKTCLWNYPWLDYLQKMDFGINNFLGKVDYFSLKFIKKGRMDVV